MASFKDLFDRLNAEIEKKEDKIEKLRERKRATKDAVEKGELQEEIDALETERKELIDQRRGLSGAARGTGSWDPNSSYCLLRAHPPTHRHASARFHCFKWSRLGARWCKASSSSLWPCCANHLLPSTHWICQISCSGESIHAVHVPLPQLP